MPVTARLLQRLQETQGEGAADDLFAWFDEAGWVNHSAVREIADLYFGRFEARLEQRLSETRADLIKWMFLFWAGTVVPLAGLIIALHRF